MTVIAINSSASIDYDGSNFIVNGDTVFGPLVINNTDISNPLVINLISDIALTSSNDYLIFNSDNIVFNGNGHTITLDGITNYNGFIDNADAYSGAIVQNVHFDAVNGATIRSNAGVVADSFAGVIDYVSSSIDITGAGSGGLVGVMLGQIMHSYTTGSISGNFAGGLVGMDASSTNITESYSTGVISGFGAGGIFGATASDSSAVDCYTTGSLFGLYAGGIFGMQGNNLTISESYYFGSVLNLGAAIFFGADANSSSISNSYGTVVSSYIPRIFGGSGHLSQIESNTHVDDNGSWDDVIAQTTIGDIDVWSQSAPNTPYLLAANHTGSVDVGSNNPWVGNTLHAYLMDPVLNGGNGFFVDSASPNINYYGRTYQWFADGVAISGATGSTYRVAPQHFNQAISVQIDYAVSSGAGSNRLFSPASSAINGIYDTAANVSTYLDVIQANHSTISNALSSAGAFEILDGATTATLFTTAQLTTATDALTLIVGQGYLAGVRDGSQNLVTQLNTIEARIGDISSLQITDTGVVGITSTQAATLASAFAAGSDFHIIGRHDAANILYNAASDGTLYIKTSGATLGTLASGTSILFSDLFVSTAGLIANGSTTPLFQSSGGINGLTLPDLFTGPSSLGLTYQLIETAQNAVVTGSSFSEFIKVANSNSIGKAVNGNGGNDVIDGGEGSTFVTGGANHNTTFFLDGRAPGTSWSTITDFQAGVDKATIWGFVKGVSSIDTSFTNYNNEGAAGYQGLTLHFKNLLPDGQTTGSNPNLNSITFTGHSLEEFGVSSLAELNAQINAGTNAHILVGSTQDSLGTHSYLYIH